MIILFRHHLRTSNFHRIELIILDGFTYPIIDVNIPLIEVFRFQLRLVRLYLIGVTFLLVNYETTVLFNEFL
jgi:hypothetical protein